MLCSSFLGAPGGHIKKPAGCNCIQPGKDIGNYSAAQPQAVFITEGTTENHKQINKPADAKYAAGEHPQYTGSYLADVKPMNTHEAKQQAEEKSRPAAFLGSHAIDPGNGLVDICVCVGVIDDNRWLGRLILGLVDRFVYALLDSIALAGDQLRTAVGAERGSWDNLGLTAGADTLSLRRTAFRTEFAAFFQHCAAFNTLHKIPLFLKAEPFHKKL